jgi:UDP-N-acetylmuramoyl-tripeptide--D-alanyl-D-alanine ligase
MEYFYIFTHILLVVTLGWYLATNLQWYNYKIQRVILKHHKIQWHLIYFITPIFLYYILQNIYFFVYFYLLYLPSFVFWNKNLDKSLVFTARIKRFFGLLFFIVFCFDLLLFLKHSLFYGVFIPLFLAYGISWIIEQIIFISYKSKATQKLNSIDNLIVIAITASYGKTSIKNYLYQVLSKHYKTYMTPRSVNTLAGIVKDINEDLPLDTQIYIVEAGARQQGDIEEIALFVKPHYSILGNVGNQHIEYFKTLDNIIYTKMEILKSPRLRHGFVHKSVPILKYDTITTYPQELIITQSDLNGIWFDTKIDHHIEHFHAPILGKFNATNLTAVILVAHHLGLSIEQIKVALHNLKQVDHRLSLTKANGKLILDDSFNGNLEGMLEAIELVENYQGNGKKVIITPGLVESTKEANIELALRIDEVFDIVIITGALNAKIFKDTLTKTKPIFLSDKSKLQEVLQQTTNINDIILFANDAPNFI